MAITFLQEIWSNRDGSSDQHAVRKYKRVWLVRTNTMLSGPLEVTDDARLPRKFSSYVALNGEFDRGSTLREYAVKGTDDPFTWIVEASYSSERNVRRISYDRNRAEGSGQNKGDAKEQNPTLRPVEVKFSTQKFKMPLAADANNKAVASSNGEKFDPPLEIDQSRILMTISKNLASFPNSLFFNADPTQVYQDVLNSDTWTMPTELGNFVFQPNTVKLDAPAADTATENGFFFWRVSIQFAIRVSWVVNVLNVGTYTNDGMGNIKPIVDPKTYYPVAGAVPLDQNGNPLSLTPPIAYTYSTFSPHPALPFTPLNTLLNLP